MDPASPLITVPLPTVDGREDYLEKAITAYERHANVEILLYRNEPGCGSAWAKGAAAAKGDYIHFGADDVEMHKGWWQAATHACDMGFLPAPRVLNTDGTLQSCGDWEVDMPNGAQPEFTRGPFVSRGQWERIGPIISRFLETAHYFTDNAFTWAGFHLGIPTVVVRAYEYTHHLAPESRGAGMSWGGRMQHDFDLFVAYINDYEKGK